MLEINPNANIIALQDIYEEANTDKFQLDTFDYIIDAIDSLENKMQLLRHTTRTKATVLSSMGAALKMDPTKIKVAEFWKVTGCPLARALRDKFKRKKLKPAKNGTMAHAVAIFGFTLAGLVMNNIYQKALTQAE